MNADEKKIRQAFKEKNWNAIKTSDSWQIFKIMSEFVEGFETMSKIGPCVSVFGSARTKSDNKLYKQAEENSKGQQISIKCFSAVIKLVDLCCLIISTSSAVLR